VSDNEISLKCFETVSIDSHKALSVSLKAWPGLPESYNNLDIDIVFALFSNLEEKSRQADTIIP